MKTSVVKLDKITPHDLPSPPEVAIRIVRAATEPDITARELQNIVSNDTALVAELLRVANSPYFGYRQRVAKVEQALVILGTKTLRNIALLFISRETLRNSPMSSADAQAFWEVSLCRAVCARLLAGAVDVDLDDAFTAGILHDMGTMALFVAYPHMAPAWQEISRCDPEGRRRKEKELFSLSHDEVANLLMDAWGLPDEIILPLSSHHNAFLDDLSPKLKKMCSVTLCAEWMAAVYTVADKRLALVRCRHLLLENFSLDQSAVDQLLTQVPAALAEAATALGVKLTQHLQFEEVLNNANRWLIEQHQDRDQLVRNMEMALEQRERLAEELQNAYGRLAQQAYYDPLTSLVNRRRFDEIVLGELARHGRSARNLSLLVLDLDAFKAINDGHGHAMGDTVLQVVAQTVRNSLRTTDVAARLGGDEMCILLPETDDGGGKIAADRVRRAIEGLRFDIPSIQVTCSIGGSSWLGQNILRGDAADQLRKTLVSTADQALYFAKKNGRNQVQWKPLE